MWHSANAETLAISARSSVTLRKIMIQLGYVERLWDSCDDECASVDAGCLNSIGERTAHWAEATVKAKHRRFYLLQV